VNAFKKRIHVQVSPEGEITVEAHGFYGRGCEAATAAIEAALGSPGKRTRKPVFWRRERQQNTRGRNTQQLGGERGGGSGEGET
jgi:hypothetical protein